jgi:hypothetical protein
MHKIAAVLLAHLGLAGAVATAWAGQPNVPTPVTLNSRDGTVVQPPGHAVTKRRALTLGVRVIDAARGFACAPLFVTGWRDEPADFCRERLGECVAPAFSNGTPPTIRTALTISRPQL